METKTYPMGRNQLNGAEPVRLMYCDPVTEPAGLFQGWYRETIATVARPGTAIDFVCIKEGYMDPTTPYTAFYNARGQIERAYEAAKKGYDAFIIGCAWDSGLKECRSMVDIPVVAPIESAALLSCTLGNKFSIIVMEQHWIPPFENMIRSYGLEDRLASIRCPRELVFADAIGMMFEGEEREAKLVELLIEEMSKAVKEDGAEAVLVACTCTSSMLAKRHIYHVDGVPIIDGVAAAIKMAETLVDFRKSYGISTCKKGTHYPPPPGWEKDIPIAVD